MSSPSDQQPGLGFVERMRRDLNVLAMVAGVFAAFGEVTFFRTNFGERYFRGWKTALVVPLLILFPIFWPHEDPRPVMLCLPLYLIMCRVHRVNINRRRMRGERGIHSLYNGVSRLQRRFPKESEQDIKSKREPGMMLLIGLATLVVSAPLGWLFIWTSAGMAAHASLLVAHDQQRALDISDARIEGEMLAGASREPALEESLHTNHVVRIHGRQS